MRKELKAVDECASLCYAILALGSSLTEAIIFK